MNTPALLLLTTLVAAIDLIAVTKGWKVVEYFAKPGVMALLIAWLFTQGAISGPLVWFVVGAIFSLAGDVFLMIPRENLFMPGLVSFLLAQLAYLVGFIYFGPTLNPAAILLFGLVALTSGQLYKRVAASLKERGETSLRLPVLIYTTAISLMVLSALFTLLRGDWKIVPAMLVSAGALFFYLSDGTLAWNKFVSPLKHERFIVISLYHLGQIGILVGVAQQFSGV